jgi:formylglycine-generating enzyme required for sulfatase activity
MTFDLTRWQSEVRVWWAGLGPRLQSAPIESAYALLAASAWLPLLAAYTHDPGPATTVLVGITASVGSNLVANLVQRAYDRARGGEQVAGQAHESAQARAELDAVLQATQALEAAQAALGERWDAFARLLAQEMAALPGRSSLTVTLGDGTVVGGSVVTGDLTLTHSTFVGRDQVTVQGDGNVVGDGSRATVIKTGDHSPVTFVEDTRSQDEARRQEHALRTYLERLAGECNVLYLRGMDPHAADVTRQETMSLAAVYTALDTTRRMPLSDEELTALKERGVETGFFPKNPVSGAGARPERAMSALEAASRFDRLVLLGDPGAGKSTFINYLAFRLARASLDAHHRREQAMVGADVLRAENQVEALPGWTRGPLVPLRVILRDLARSPCLAGHGTATALWTFVEQTLAEADLASAAPALKARLDGRAVLLLDGLDEVEAEARQRVLDAVADFALTHRRTPVLVTCRVYAYQEPQWRLAGFEQATLAPFDQEHIDRFVAAWYAEVARLGLMSGAETGGRAARLRDAVRRPDLRVLAPNPLLLTMMALLHSSWGRLPQDRVQLYSEIVELLLSRWEESHLGREVLTRARLSPRDLRFALEEVAFAAHGQQPAGEGTADVAESLLREVLQGFLEGDWNRAGEVISYVRERAGLLLERKPGVYGFPHRTLQEYLAGCHLSVQADFPSRAADLVRDEETRWREPFLLAVGKTARAENRVDLALGAVDNLCPRAYLAHPADERAYRCAWLAGDALLEVGVDTLCCREAWQARLERVADWLARLLEAGVLAPVERAAAGRVLGRLGDPRNLNEVVFVPGGPFTMGSGKRDKEAFDDERPQHTVEVADFWIGKYPVTNGQYRRFVEAGGYDERRYWTEAGWAWRQSEHKRWGRQHGDRPEWWDDPAWNLPNHPVVGVTWFEALAYTRWLAEATGRPCRLPTEAEWEKAARGTDGHIYPWGNDEITPERANYDETGIGRTSAVGCFLGDCSPYGCLDMAGNVWEWCSSVGNTETEYPYQADDGREDLERDAARALRGGCWNGSRKFARCSDRFDFSPVFYEVNVGFRMVFPGSPPSAS